MSYVDFFEKQKNWLLIIALISHGQITAGANNCLSARQNLAEN
jgi:hypothetical protein